MNIVLTYMTISISLLIIGHECTEPVGAPNRARFMRLVDMYSSVTQKHREKKASNHLEIIA